MEYEIKDLIGMMNIALIIANGKKEENVSIPKDAALKIVGNLEALELLFEMFDNYKAIMKSLDVLDS